MKKISMFSLECKIPVYGDLKYRGIDASEANEQMTFVAEVRKTPQGAGLFHIKNEGKRTEKQIFYDKANGMTRGASDIIILGSPTFVCEIKRRHATKAKTDQDQIGFLLYAQSVGCFACFAMGYEAALKAFDEWVALSPVSINKTYWKNKHGYLRMNALHVTTTKDITQATSLSTLPICARYMGFIEVVREWRCVDV